MHPENHPAIAVDQEIQCWPPDNGGSVILADQEDICYRGINLSRRARAGEKGFCPVDGRTAFQGIVPGPIPALCFFKKILILPMPVQELIAGRDFIRRKQ